MYSLIQGDLEPDMEIDVATDLTGALSVNMRWLRPDGTHSVVGLTVIDLPTGRLKRIWVAGDSDVVGSHRGQVVVTYAGGTSSYPTDGSPVVWNVYPKIGA